MVVAQHITCGGQDLSFERTLIMGVVNVTPDSFSDGGLYFDAKAAVAHAKQLELDGADLIDVGGESTRPGSAPLSVEEELGRVLPVVTRLIQEVSVPVSIDTYKPQVAEACLKTGAHLLNDITGLANPAMVALAAEYNVPVVIMHMMGTPKTMQEHPIYHDVIGEINTFFKERIAVAQMGGIKNIILDPGIGFGKTLEHNLLILKHLDAFMIHGWPVLVGPSRKSFIGTLTGLSPQERLEGTIAAVAIAAMKGAHIVRVHDVRECKRAIQVVDAIRGA
ncbi:MAG TPA: dihydropteroate synthase [Candidatus Thermoplasmatota archaeon]|nr:dihydropteroate synthase [Candidatus Thermoplasmatota archaeon]